jgi:hypothetical protein
MKTVWEKRPGRWKVSGETKVFPTKEAAIEWAATLFEVVEEAPDPAPEPETDWLDQYEEELIAEEEVDPLEALKQARINNGSIEEGSDHEPDHEEQGFSEGSD